MQRLSAFLALPLLAAACGMGSSGMTTTQVQDFRSAAVGVSTTAASYGAQAGAMSDLPTCTADEAGYHAQVAPMVDRMAAMAGAMDGHMASMGHPADGDMACGAAAMMAELARHHAIACASTGDMAPNRAEAAQHVAAMGAWSDHMAERADQMGSRMGMTMMGSSGGAGGTVTGLCVRLPDGSYVLQP